jgi:hypothetical protein
LLLRRLLGPFSNPKEQNARWIRGFDRTIVAAIVCPGSQSAYLLSVSASHAT